MNAYTSPLQSVELGKFLPLESADMYYHTYPSYKCWTGVPNIGKADLKDDQMPCWSLAALLDVMPDGTDIVKNKADTENENFMCTVEVKDDIISTFGNNPVDACVEMILKLHEQKLL